MMKKTTPNTKAWGCRLLGIIFPYELLSKEYRQLSDP